MDSTCTWDIVSGGIEINLGNIHIGCPNQLRAVKAVSIISFIEILINKYLIYGKVILM